MKAVFDTNVLLAAFLTEGVCEKLFTRARKRHFDLITCPFILDEFEQILTKKFSASKREKEAALAMIAEAATDIVRPSEVLSGACRDKGEPMGSGLLSCHSDFSDSIVGFGSGLTT